MMGNTAEEACREMQALGATATGANCGGGPDVVLGALLGFVGVLAAHSL